MSQRFTPASSAIVSLPTNKPFRLIIDVTPVRGESVFPGPSQNYRVLTGVERLDLAITVEKTVEVCND